MKALHQQANGYNVSLDRPRKKEVQLIAVIVSPVANAAERFAVRHDGRLLVSSSSTPFCAAARVLLDEGIDPATRLVMRHEWSDTIALAALLGTAAKLTVDESNGTRFAPWKPFPRSAGSPPIAAKRSRHETAGSEAKLIAEMPIVASPEIEIVTPGADKAKGATAPSPGTADIPAVEATTFVASSAEVEPRHPHRIRSEQGASE